NLQTAFWTALGIPVSLLGMLIFLRSMDISLNLISLAGFIIIIGMLVDDAVVIAEEYNKNREMGMEPKDAAKEAVGRMWSPVLASTLTTIIAFAPLFMVGGFPGAFIWTIPLMVIVGLSFSLLESFVMLPVHLTHSKKMEHGENKWMNRIESLYKRTIMFALKKRYFVLAGFTLLLILSMVTLRMIIKKDPFPQDAAESFRISLTYPLGYTEAQTEEAIRSIENLISKIPEEELLGYSVRIGTHSESSYAKRGTQNNLATIFVYLTSYQSRGRTAMEIMELVRSDLEELKKTQKQSESSNPFRYVINLNRIGPPMGRDIEIRIISNNDEIRKEKERAILEYLSGLEGVLETETDQVEGLREIVVNLDQRKLGITGLTVDDVLVSMKMAIDGIIVTDISRGEDRLDFRLKLQEGAIKDPEFNRQKLLSRQESVLPILNKAGYSIKMPEIVNLRERSSEASIMRLDGIRTSTVFANLNGKILPPTDLMKMIREEFPNESNFTIEFSGQPVETELIFSGLVQAGMVAILGVYLMIALIFNSYSRPAVVMFSLPFMAIGLALVLLTHGIPGSMMVGIAVVGLMGVVVNASIVLIDTITKWNSDGKVDMITIVEGSVSRLRPILLTATTTILGVLPTGYGIGGSDPFLSHMSLVLAYGLFFATAIILILVPVQYMIGIDIRKKTEKLFR
ncbi:MAG: efflux RND transporter permease subunit, partial [Leptospira sp.]|nr:efflux RND transporter permease subunit [Leptospira sp.]